MDKNKNKFPYVTVKRNVYFDLDTYPVDQRSIPWSTKRWIEYGSTGKQGKLKSGSRGNELGIVVGGGERGDSCVDFMDKGI